MKSLLEHFGAHLGSDRQSAPAGSILEMTLPHRVCGVSSFFCLFCSVLLAWIHPALPSPVPKSCWRWILFVILCASCVLAWQFSAQSDRQGNCPMAVPASSSSSSSSSSSIIQYCFWGIIVYNRYDIIYIECLLRSFRPCPCLLFLAV